MGTRIIFDICSLCHIGYSLGEMTLGVCPLSSGDIIDVSKLVNKSQRRPYETKH
jgi:hypothetical protein